MTDMRIISLHVATADDDGALRDLSLLDSARPVRRPAVLATVDERPVAALSLTDGRVVADPFTRSADVVALLRVRHAGLGTSRRAA
jgi:hypothetical protein